MDSGKLPEKCLLFALSQSECCAILIFIALWVHSDISSPDNQEDPIGESLLSGWCLGDGPRALNTRGKKRKFTVGPDTMKRLPYGLQRSRQPCLFVALKGLAARLIAAFWIFAYYFLYFLLGDSRALFIPLTSADSQSSLTFSFFSFSQRKGEKGK